MSEPVRTCVGCRRRAPASELARIVVAADAAGSDDVSRVVVDARRRLPGRGAWLHADAACLEAARKRNAFRRALRVAGRLDDSGVESWLG